MKTFHKYIYLSLCLMLAVALSGCKKQDDFLSAIPTSYLTVPNTLDDLQLLLQGEGSFNSGDPDLGVLGGDEYYVTNSTWISAGDFEQKCYVWDPNPYENQSVPDWSDSYSQVYYANTVLDGLAGIKVSADQQVRADAIKASALTFRARSFFNLMQIFSPPYDSASASGAPGILLRLSSNLNEQYGRASQEDCYKQIVNDLLLAIPALPTTFQFPSQPSKMGAMGLLARIYLVMGNYAKAYEQADAALQMDNRLTDYNSLVLTDYNLTSDNQYPLIEDQFHAELTNYGTTTFGSAIVDSTLYQSYDPDDLRKTFFFQLYNGGMRFKGSYQFKTGRYNYDGIATDELYLIRAECNARSGNVTAAMDDLNTLLTARYRTGTYVPRTAATADAALDLVLGERRKELIFRGLRWMDLRRLNRDPRFAKTLTRVINGGTYTLPPNDPRYTWLIPDDEIRLSKLQQNTR